MLSDTPPTAGGRRRGSSGEPPMSRRGTRMPLSLLHLGAVLEERRPCDPRRQRGADRRRRAGDAGRAAARPRRRDGDAGAPGGARDRNIGRDQGRPPRRFRSPGAATSPRCIPTRRSTRRTSTTSSGDRARRRCSSCSSAFPTPARPATLRLGPRQLGDPRRRRSDLEARRRVPFTTPNGRSSAPTRFPPLPYERLGDVRGYLRPASWASAPPSTRPRSAAASSASSAGWCRC